MSEYRKAINLDKPSNQEAVKKANAAIAPKTGGKQLTMGPEDADSRKKWMDAYIAAGGEYKVVNLTGKKPKDPRTLCPCPTKVQFKEDGDGYGFDDHTDVNCPWRSVEKGKSDTVKAEITPADRATRAEFSSNDTSKVTVSPGKAASANQVVTIIGVEIGESEIKSTCSGGTLGRMKAKTYVKKTKTVAVRLVHEKNYNSTDVSDVAVKTFLQKVYKQAVFEFKMDHLPAKTVEFDKNKDGKLDVNSWMSDEMKAIRDECKDDSYDHNLFVVSKPTDNSFGFMGFNQRYGFIHADQTTTPEKSVAHELGHGAFGLTHPAGDPDNNMTQGEGLNMWRLRKDQWDKINP